MTDPADSFATPRIAAGALFRNARGDVLMVQPTYKDTWDLPGGYVERANHPQPHAAGRCVRSWASTVPSCP